MFGLFAGRGGNRLSAMVVGHGWRRRHGNCGGSEQKRANEFHGCTPVMSKMAATRAWQHCMARLIHEVARVGHPVLYELRARSTNGTGPKLRIKPARLKGRAEIHSITRPRTITQSTFSSKLTSARGLPVTAMISAE